MLAALCLPLLALGSCGLLPGGSGTSREQALGRPQASFEPDGITVQVRADEALNPAQGQPHSVVVGIVQAAAADTLRSLGDDPARVLESLASGEPLPGTLQLDRFVVFPAQRCTIRTDRVRDALAVALAVGYANDDGDAGASADTPLRASPPGALAVFELPLRLSSQGWLWRSYTARVAPLRLRLRLGPRQLLDASVVPDPATTSTETLATRPPDCLALRPATARNRP